LQEYSIFKGVYW